MHTGGDKEGWECFSVSEDSLSADARIRLARGPSRGSLADPVSSGGTRGLEPKRTGRVMFTSMYACGNQNATDVLYSRQRMRISVRKTCMYAEGGKVVQTVPEEHAC